MSDVPPPKPRGADGSRQLLRRQLSAVLRLDAGGGGGRRAARAAPRRRSPARRSGSTCTSRSAGSAATSATSASTPTRTPRRSTPTSTLIAREWELYAHAAGDRRPAARLRLLRRRHAVVPLDHAARRPGLAPQGGDAVGSRRGSDLRVRAGHADRAEALGDPRHRRHAPQPRRRALRRPDPRAERPRPPLGGDRPRLRLRPRPRLPADQHRPDRRHARRDRRQVDSAPSTSALELEPDSVTIYQMELPFNTTISRDKLKHLGQFEETVAGWDTKRRWVDEAFARLERAGYHVGSAYTVVKDPAKARFVYRDRLWQGADLAGLGVASFGHVNGVHLQNLDSWETYAAGIEAGAPPLARAYRPSADERLIREFVLQLKKGAVAPSYFAGKYGVDVLDRFARAARVAAARGLPRRARPGPHRADAAGAAPRRRAAAPLLPAPAHGDPLHLMPVDRLARDPLARGPRRPTRAPCPARSTRSTSPTRGPAWSRRRRRRSRRTQIPQPYRSLLVHQRDMTLTLEAHFGGRVVLRPLSTFISGPLVLPPRAARAGVLGPAGRDGRDPHEAGGAAAQGPGGDPPQPGAARPHPARRRRRFHEHAARVLRGRRRTPR